MSKLATHKRCCQVLIIGSQRNRVSKVKSLLTEEEKSYSMDSTQSDQSESIKIDYLPCVAKFDSYCNHDNGEMIRYLSSVGYHGTDGKQINESSIATFFDAMNDVESREEDSVINMGVIAVAVGSGIETDEDMNMIRKFINLISGGDKIEENNNKKIPALPVMEIIKCNPEYKSMTEETNAFRALNVNDKAEVTVNRILGPGKMAGFVYNLTSKVLKQLLDEECNVNSHSNINKETQIEGVTNDADVNEELSEEAILSPYEIARQCFTAEDLTTKTYYACRLCRIPLFTTDHLEDPPHTTAKHNFNKKKQSQSSSICQSIFLADAVPWMGDITTSMEGRIVCPQPNCQAKLGIWKWAGNQCSCGTWVTPAIQVPMSKLDKVQPRLRFNYQ